jgi:hypothetical protein
VGDKLERPKDLIPLTSDELRVISWAEEYWHLHKRFPPVGSFSSRWPDLNLDKFLEHKTVQLAFHNRGIKTPSPSDNLNEEQLAAIFTVSNYEDRRPITAKLKSLGIKSTQWNGWKKDPHFREFLHKMLGESLDSALDRAHEGLMKALDKGDVNAIKYFMELTGRVPDQGQQNFRIAVARLIESIQRHVSDAGTLKAIGQDFEMIISGRAPVGRQLNSNIVSSEIEMPDLEI